MNEPNRLLGVLLRLAAILPGDPSIQFGLGEIYSSPGPLFDATKASAAFRAFLDTTTDESFGVDSPFGRKIRTKSDLTAALHRLSSANWGDDVQQIRLRVQRYLDSLQEDERLALLPPAVQEIHLLVLAAGEEQNKSHATGSRTHVQKALSKTLDKALKLTERLSGSDTAHRTGLKMLIHNTRGGCQEVLAALARHRRPQEVMQIRARIQGLAIREYEQTLNLEGSADHLGGVSAKAWALYRIAELAAAISVHHSERRDSYIKFGRTYPQTRLIEDYRLKSYTAAKRLRAEYPSEKDQSRRLLTSLLR